MSDSNSGASAEAAAQSGQTKPDQVTSAKATRGKAEASGNASDLVQAVVAPRRSVQQGNRKHGPGAIVHFMANEVARLRGLGYLLPASGEVEIPVDGPTVNNERVDVVRPK